MGSCPLFFHSSCTLDQRERGLVNFVKLCKKIGYRAMKSALVCFSITLKQPLPIYSQKYKCYKNICNKDVHKNVLSIISYGYSDSIALSHLYLCLEKVKKFIGY